MAKKSKSEDILADVEIEETKSETKVKEGDLKSEAKSEVKKPKSLVLIFKGAGWCEELQTSYFQGVYNCKNEREFEILKKYSTTPK